MNPVSAILKLRSDKVIEGQQTNYGSEWQIQPLKNSFIDCTTKILYLDGVTLAYSHNVGGSRLTLRGDSSSYFFTFLVKGGTRLHMRDFESDFSPGEFFIADGQNYIGSETDSDTQFESIIVTSEFLHAELSILLGYPCRHRLKFIFSRRGYSDAWLAITSIAQAIRANADLNPSSPIAISLLRQALINAILERSFHNYSEHIHGTRLEVLPGVMTRALDFMADCAHMPIGLTDIALASGTSGRNLQLLFKAHRGISPLSVLRDIRLQRCREELLRDGVDNSVKVVALRWGFTNQFRFSCYYGQRFGETPSETRARRSK